MKPTHYLSLLFLLLMGCDPVHSLQLENGTKDGDLEVLYASDLYFNDKVIEGYELTGDKSIKRTMLAPGETMEIGTVHARYQPRPDDVKIDYLEIRYRNDTIVLKGRRAIFSTIQKIESLDWRFVVK